MTTPRKASVGEKIEYYFRPPTVYLRDFIRFVDTCSEPRTSKNKDRALLLKTSSSSQEACKTAFFYLKLIYYYTLVSMSIAKLRIFSSFCYVIVFLFRFVELLSKRLMLAWRFRFVSFDSESSFFSNWEDSGSDFLTTFYLLALTNHDYPSFK